MGNTNNNAVNNGEKRTPWSKAHFYEPQFGYMEAGTLPNGEKYYVQRPSALSDVILDTTGFIEKVEIRNVKTEDREKKVCDVTLDTYIGDKKTIRYFGSSFVREDHRVRFKFTVWEDQADNIEKLKLNKGDTVQCMLYSMDPETGTTNNGNTYRNVKANLVHYTLDIIKRCTSKQTDEQQPVYNQPMQPQQPVYNQPVQPQQPVYNQPMQPQQPVPNQVPVQQTVCSSCGITVEDNVAQYSTDKFGRVLCRNCQNTVRNASQQPAVQNNNALVCASCGSTIDSAVADFSNRKFGRYLCRNCQTAARQQPHPQQTQAPAQPQQAPAQPQFGYSGDQALFQELDGVDESNPFYN